MRTIQIPSLAIFDLGNVVFRVDWEPMFESWAIDSGLGVKDLQERFHFGPDFDAFEKGDIPGNDFSYCVNKMLGTELSYTQFKAGWNSIYREVVPEVEYTLKQLQGKVKLVAYTNTNAIHNEVWPIKYKEVLKYFEQIFISSEIGFRKPDIEGYQYVLKACKMEASSSMFFDDKEENIAGAQQIGIESYLVDSDLVVSDVFGHFSFL